MEITNEELNKFCLKNFGTNEPLSRTGEPLKPLLAELANANLAGMEPRCPKCGETQLQVCSSSSGKKGIRARVLISCVTCGEEYNFTDMSDFAQFFRSPAPTPPLDVEAIAREIYLETEGFTALGKQAFVAHKADKAEMEKIVAILRRHIASPAQPEKE